MSTKQLGIFLVAIIAFTFFGLSQSWAQGSPQDSSGRGQSSSNRARSQQTPEEITLETIHIEAVIEMPRVAIIPRRLKTDMGTYEFGFRSFDKELREKPKVLSSILQELESAKRMKMLKKTLAKKTN